ncbi:MAG: FtsQ-type POTRA domain-containing protein [Pseudomonadota bacterium]
MPAVKKKSKKKATKRKTTARGKSQDRNRWRDLTEPFANIRGAAMAAALAVLVLSMGVAWIGGYFGRAAGFASDVAGGISIASGFEIEKVTVRGLDRTSEADLLTAIGPILGASILHFDHHAARARVQELGWVRDAAVSRLLPNTINISVRERRPSAVWQMSGDLFLIDRFGAVIDEVNAYEYSNMPLIVGAGAPESAAGLIMALEKNDNLHAKTAALVRVGDRRWNVRLKNGIDIKLPENNATGTLAKIETLHHAYGILDDEIEFIDFRNDERVVIRRIGAAEDEPANFDTQ